MIKAKLTAVFSVLVFWMATQVVAAEQSVQAAGAWVRMVPPVASNSAAYMVLTNTGSETQVIRSASSPVARHVEVHQTSMQDGVMRMSEVKELVIPAEGELEMKPGGYHVMLIDLIAPLKEGQLVPVEVVFESGVSLKVDATVKPMSGHSGMKMQGH